MIRVEVIRAWPRRFETITVTLPDTATVGDALDASRFALDEISGYAIFGERVVHGDMVRDGDRLELLRPLQIDPKESRRRRAQKK